MNWTPELTDRALAMRGREMTMEQIGAVIGRSKWAVSKRLCRHALANGAHPKTIQPMPPRIREFSERRAIELGVSLPMIIYSGKSWCFAHPRQDIWLAIRDEIVMPDGKPPSYPLIGRWFGRDHTTVMYGVRKARERASDTAA